MIFAAYLPSKGHEFDGKNAKKIFLRDRFNHASPNSAQTESVCAGALRVRLAGDAWYFGKLVKKKYIGDDLRPVETGGYPPGKQTSLPDVVDPDGDLCDVGSSYGDFIEIISKELGLT